MKDYKLKQRNLRASHTLVFFFTVFFVFFSFFFSRATLLCLLRARSSASRATVSLEAKGEMGGPGSRISTPKRRGNIMGNMQGGQPFVGLAPYPNFFDHPKKKGKGKVRLPLICKKFPPTNIFLSGYSSSVSWTQACIESSAQDDGLQQKKCIYRTVACSCASKRAFSLSHM